MNNTTLLLIILLIPILIFHWLSFWKPLFIERKIQRDLEQASEWNKFIKTAAVDKKFYKSKLMARAIKNTIKEKKLDASIIAWTIKITFKATTDTAIRLSKNINLLILFKKYNFYNDDKNIK